MGGLWHGHAQRAVGERRGELRLRVLPPQQQHQCRGLRWIAVARLPAPCEHVFGGAAPHHPRGQHEAGGARAGAGASSYAIP
jgi:hypothetical protein